MKKRIITPLLLLFFITGFSQNINYQVRGTYAPVKKEKLNQVHFLGDIIPYYQEQKNAPYISVEVVATCNGKSVSATCTSDSLSIEQNNILNTADLGTLLVININYKYSKLVYSAIVVPEIEAEFADGNQQMTKYLNETAINKISRPVSGLLPIVTVKFTVNENGEIASAQVSETSGNPETDKLLLEAITKMPKWKPAKNSKGLTVKQEFEIRIGGGC